MRISRPLQVLMSFALVVVASTVACDSTRPFEINGVQTSSTSVPLGHELRVLLYTNGPGEYRSPPTLADSGLQFVIADIVGPNRPAGATQVFRFQAVARGRSIVRFEHSEGGYSVTDTVTVY